MRLTPLPLLGRAAPELTTPAMSNHLEPNQERPLGSEERNGQVRKLGQSFSGLAAG